MVSLLPGGLLVVQNQMHLYPTHMARAPSNTPRRSALGREKEIQQIASARAHGGVLCAVATDKADLVEVAVTKGCNVNATDCWKNSCLLLAAAQGSLDILPILLKAGADVAPKNQDSMSALHYAACEGQHAVAQVLMSAGANVNAKSGDGRTPLGWAKACGHHEVEALLLQHGAK
jgi:ankyrin repeat protein